MRGDYKDDESKRVTFLRCSDSCMCSEERWELVKTQNDFYYIHINNDNIQQNTKTITQPPKPQPQPPRADLDIKHKITTKDLFSL